MVKCNNGYDKLGLSYEDLVQICIQHLKREIEIIKPRIIICLGRDVEKEFNRFKHLFEINGVKISYLQHPCRVEGKKEYTYINKIREIVF